MKPRLLWVTDPWSTLDHPKDTTLRLIDESLKLGIESFWCDVKTIRYDLGRALLDASACKRARGNDSPLGTAALPAMAKPRTMEPKQFTRIIYRTDPPVDHAYLHPLQLLHLGMEGQKNSEMVNPFPVLFNGNEKLEPATLGTRFIPASCISSDWETLLRFGKKEGRAVLKPLYLAQSLGIELLDFRKKDGIERARKLINSATQEGQRPILVQRYLEGILDGEQRLWFLNGRLLAAARKNPKRGEFKIDMDAGAFVTQTSLNAREKAAAAAIGKRLRATHTRLAAVDLIEGLATDFNFTSPGLINQMEAVLGENLARPIVESIARSWR